MQGIVGERWGHGSKASTLLALFMSWRVSEGTSGTWEGGFWTELHVQLPSLLSAALLVNSGGLTCLCESKQSHCRLPGACRRSGPDEGERGRWLRRELLRPRLFAL